MLARYRATGADLPWSDLRRGHGVALDGYFWRFSDPASGRVIVALCGVCRDGAGGSWANLGLAAHPGGFLADADVPAAGSDPERYAVWAEGDLAGLRADAASLHLEIGAEAGIAVDLIPRHDFARPFLGGVGVAQMLPGLGQYWHPHLLGAEVRGSAWLGSERVRLDGWQAYAERNWGGAGFPRRWWWGQAQGFEREDVCVAFAGGELTVGRARLEATGLVLALGDRVLRWGNPLLSRVHATVSPGAWRMQGRWAGWGVELEGRADPAEAHRLPVPLPEQRRSVHTAHEHLAGELALTVTRRGRTVFAGTSPLAGLEVGEAPGPQ